MREQLGMEIIPVSALTRSVNPHTILMVKSPIPSKTFAISAPLTQIEILSINKTNETYNNNDDSLMLNSVGIIRECSYAHNILNTFNL
jgi:hypothetical protein